MISVIRIEETEKWDRIVRGFRSYDVSYLNGYSRAFQLHGNGEPFLFYYEDGGTKAMNVLFRRDIARQPQLHGKLPEDSWFDLSTPYGYGGFWVEGGSFEAVNDAYDAYCREQGFVSEFVRFHLNSGFEKQYRGTAEMRTHNVVRSLDLPLEEMQKDFEHKVRKNLKRAVASNLTVETDPDGTKLSDFLRIYYGTLERAGAVRDFFFSEAFFETLIQMNGHVIFFHVISEGKIVSTELILYGTENCYSFLGGTDGDYFHLRPNELLKYEVIKWAKSKGLRRFVLGGGYGDDDGIYKYKKSLAPNGIRDFYIGKRIFDREKYETLVSLRKQEPPFDESSAFFPLYRS